MSFIRFLSVAREDYEDNVCGLRAIFLVINCPNTCHFKVYIDYSIIPQECTLQHTIQE